MGFKKIGIIGAGTMGISISIDFLVHGLSVVLVDISEITLNKAKEEILKGVRFAPLLKKLAYVVKLEEALDNIVFTQDINELKHCEFIIENVTEDKSIKKEVYNNIDKICNKEVCFGVNTSCISITEVGAMTSRQDKVIGMHFMNPSLLKPSIEVIKGFHTSEETINTAKNLLAQVEKDAIIVNDLPGFVSNRISHLFMNEAAFVVQDQVASPSDVDDIFKKCYGHKMGPLETADLIGLDTVVNSLDVLYESYQDSKYRCCPLLRKMVQAGLHGRKSGRGFYNY